jgi:hypothetical protein
MIIVDNDNNRGSGTVCDALRRKSRKKHSAAGFPAFANFIIAE